MSFQIRPQQEFLVSTGPAGRPCPASPNYPTTCYGCGTVTSGACSAASMPPNGAAPPTTLCACSGKSPKPRSKKPPPIRASSPCIKRRATSWTPTWPALPTDSDKLVAYFSAEFGLAECLPIYSGGLGRARRRSSEVRERSRLAARRRRPAVSEGYFRQSERGRLAAGALSGERLLHPAGRARAR